MKRRYLTSSDAGLHVAISRYRAKVIMYLESLWIPLPRLGHKFFGPSTSGSPLFQQGARPRSSECSHYLLKRTMERRLKSSGTTKTTSTAFEELGCYLNLVRSNGLPEPHVRAF